MSLVSVCVPSYNASRYIAETIRSVLDSTYTNLEVIVNDDASTDHTREIVEGFDDNRVRFFQNERNLGVPGNWNRALEKASGEYVGLLNHDDLYGPFWLTFAVHTLEKHPHVGWVATAYKVIDREGQSLGVVSRFDETKEYGPAQAFPCVAKLDGLGPGYIARREILENAGCYDEDAGPGADNDLFLRLASRYPLYYSNYPHTTWRLHAGNLTRRWGLVEQTDEGLRMLDKAFGDDALLQELRKYKRACYIYVYQKILYQARQRLEQGDMETFGQLARLLYEGYKD